MTRGSISNFFHRVLNVCLNYSIFIFLIIFCRDPYKIPIYCWITIRNRKCCVLLILRLWHYYIISSAYTFEQYVLIEIGTLLTQFRSFFFLLITPASCDDFGPTSSCSTSCFTRSISSFSADCLKRSSRNLRTTWFFFIYL